MKVVTLMPLAMVAPGETVRFVSIEGGHFLKKRLADLGLNAGEEIFVIQADCHGPMILEIRDSRLALGRGVAHKILVEPSERPVN